MFCQKQFQKLTRHQRRRHKEEPSVEAAMKLKAGSDEQILAFEKVRLTGDYHHNCNVLAVGEGELIVVRKPSTMRCSRGPINYKLQGSHSRKSWH